MFVFLFLLSRHANVFANLFSLMLDANIPDIALDRDKTVKKVRRENRAFASMSIDFILVTREISSGS